MITEWLVAALSTSTEAVAGTAQAADMNAPASVWGVVMTNLFAALPPTIAAIAALVVAWRNSTKTDTLTVKTDAAANKAESAVSRAEEAVNIGSHAATQVDMAVRKVEDVAEAAEQRLSTAAEDAKRAEKAVQQIFDCISKSTDKIIAAIEANRPVEAVIIPKASKAPKK